MAMPRAAHMSRVDALSRATELLFGQPTEIASELTVTRLASCAEKQLRAAAELLRLADAQLAPKPSLVTRLSQVLSRLAADAAPRAPEPLESAVSPEETEQVA